MDDDLSDRLKDLSDLSNRYRYRPSSDSSNLFKKIFITGLILLSFYGVCSYLTEREGKKKEAKEMVERGVKEKNISLIKRSIELSGGDPYFYCEAGDYYLENGDFKTGADYYVKALEKDPDYLYAEYCLNFYNLIAARGISIRKRDIDSFWDIFRSDEIIVKWDSRLREKVKKNFLDMYQRAESDLWKNNISTLINILDNPNSSEQVIPKMDNYGTIKYIKTYEK